MKREPGIALKDALRFWESEDGLFDPQEWASRFLADRGLPAAKDRGGFHRDANTGEEIILRGRKVPIPDTDENALHSVEARFDENSGEHWAARIKRLGQPEGERLIAYLGTLALLPDARAGRKATESLKKARKVARRANVARATEARAIFAERKKSLKDAGYLPLGKRHTVKDAAAHLAERFGLEHSKAYAWLRKKRSEGKL